jgi:ribosome-associated protein
MARPTRKTTKAKKSKKPAAPKRARKPAAPKKKKLRAPRAAERPAQANEKALELARTVAAAVIDKKAVEVVILDVRGRASYADYIVVASGDSDVQLRAMADGVHEKLKAQGVRPISSEGEAGASWVLLDYGDVVAHFFDAATRSFYDLEGMWADATREAVR